ncbi:DUF2520 domain-containing protein [Panacibacter ginsenosidivorans]|uniref:DUF2520 domain-containing protein n=1 Tax=Panacibacter ginsenosidivorans TaxID=1813871 RepID=A0A5B8V4Z2_9BACT|nr:Rossmann-like and DUF2520 domain-containing protein [Panacibacter ginsenosidivorans]QEC66450.1 DUF2520 domain-containing protein [Panacibacter ginsenosidivorans]
MNIVLIGSGNVATVLGKSLKEAGHNIAAIVSRNKEHAMELARILQADSTTDIKHIYTDADLYIIAVADNAVKEVAESLHIQGKIVVHTSGAVSKDILRNVTKNYGVLYPLQSLRKEINYKPVIPLLIDSNNPETLNAIRLLAESISSKVAVANDEQRLKLHVAAVMAANFSNHLYTLTVDYCSRENIPFYMLIPLIQETAIRLNEFAPKDTQTGPAIRGDYTTIQKHLELLADYPQLKSLYESISKSITDFYGK